MTSIKEENLISLASGVNLKAGQRMWKVGNSYIPVGIGGNYNPGSLITGTIYYKCASVDTVNKTWTGYKSIFNNGIYTFEATVTSGLIYTDVEPVVGGIYSANALITANSLWDGIPTNGLYFYAPLSSDKAAAETGQALSKSGTITYQTVDGIPCAYFDGATSELYTTAAYSSFDPGIPFSGSCHIKATANNATTKFIFISMSGGGFGISIAGNTLDITVRNGSDYATVSATITLNQWHHVVFVASATELKLYVDNTLIQTVAKTGSYNTATQNYPLSMGCSHGDGSAYFFNGHLAAARLYNVILTDDDVTALFKEFTPTI